MAPAPLPPAPPSLQEALRKSTSAWQDDLQALFRNAKERFPDVVWELYADEDGAGEEVWGHKAVVYARAPPSFQARYFSFRPAPIASPTPYSATPPTIPAQSAISLSLALDFSNPNISRSPSPFRAPSPSPSGFLRIPTSINPSLFNHELEYLYTGKGLGHAFDFLFDSTESREDGDGEHSRLDKLRKDLVFMWRSRLYSDVRISLQGNFSSTNHEQQTAIFSSHRFILVSRSPYFHSALLSWSMPIPKGVDPPSLTLPSPPFTPASLFFTLGFIYAGTLVFSHRSYDLDTAFHIMRSATYLSIDTLYDEIQARIVQEMMHGLFHAFLEFQEYERITGGKWGVGGCRCRQCARRAPRIFEFAISEDVKNPNLERGARRALVGLFGEGWCTQEFTKLSQKTRDSLLKGVAKRTTAANVFALLFAVEHALEKLSSHIDAWADVSREMIKTARKNIDDLLCNQSEECFEQPDWLELLEEDGVRFEDGERVGWVMESVKRGLSDKNAAVVYQALVSSILLRPHATEIDQTMLSSTSHIRVLVEDARLEVIRFIRKRWLSIQQEAGFDPLEGWALKEISGEIDVPVEDLINPSPVAPSKGHASRAGVRSTLRNGDADTETGSMHSVRTSVLNRNVRSPLSPNARGAPASSASSVRSVAKSTLSTTSRTTSVRAPLRVRNNVASGPRPDSKLTPTATSSARSSLNGSESTTMTSTVPKHQVSTVAGRRSGPTNVANDANRPKSMAASVASVRSRASTVRKTSAPGPSTPRAPSSLSRPSTSLSNVSDTLRPGAGVARPRRPSVASTVSTVSVRTTAKTTGPQIAPKTPSRRTSTVSTTSTSARKRVAGTTAESLRMSPSTRAPSMSSVRTTSTASSATKNGSVRRGAPTDKASGVPDRLAKASERTPVGTIKGKAPVRTPLAQDKKTNAASTSSNGTLKRKGSSDTVTESLVASEYPRDPGEIRRTVSGSSSRQELPLSPHGATLEIGIPCIISSKRARFRAFARYIGEVEGEQGPWVGVEVPLDDSWTDEKLEGRPWNDGSWGGVRYFELGSGSEWEYGDDRLFKRRKFDWHGTVTVRERGLKREGDQLRMNRSKRMRSVSPAVSDGASESRGLFVRPQQVLYVVDAVGTDL